MIFLNTLYLFIFYYFFLYKNGSRKVFWWHAKFTDKWPISILDSVTRLYLSFNDFARIYLAPSKNREYAVEYLLFVYVYVCVCVCVWCMHLKGF
jgi:hypothetical protein